MCVSLPDTDQFLKFFHWQIRQTFQTSFTHLQFGDDQNFKLETQQIIIP